MKISIEQQASIDHLCQVIQCETISERANEVSNPAAFIKLHELLFSTYPAVFKQMDVHKFGEFALLLKWQGSDDAQEPMMLIAHQDVVPIPEAEYDQWQYPPFSGVLADGYICGRGALDMKSSLVAILEVVNQLILESFQPKRTVYIYLGDDEEVGGPTAKKAAQWMQSEDIRLDYIIDEGGVILDKMLPNINQPICLIGLGQKGMLNLELTVSGESGHSAKPPQTTPIDILGAAVAKLKLNDMPVHSDSLVYPLFKQLAAYMPLMQRFLINNLWLFKPLLTAKLVKNPLMNAMMRTTAAPTIFHAGFQSNVLPEISTAVINYRLYPGDTPEDVVTHVESLLKNSGVGIKVLDAFNAPKLSVTDSASFKILEKTIRGINGDEVIVAPALTIGGTDGRHFADLANNTYHFLHTRGTMDDFKGYHGINERISTKNFLNSIHFYHQLIINSQEQHG